MSFFIAAFSSILWFLFGLKSINLQNMANNPETFYQVIFSIAFPIGLIWGIFALIKSTEEQKDIRLQNLRITEQLNKNAETTNALNCAIIALEKEFKNSFMLQEVDTLIADCNEILSDIIKRSNSISSAQMEHLWNRTAGGERWLIAKTFIETNNFQPGFTDHLINKAQKDPLLKGSILEFEARTRSLYQLLEMHDTQRIFYNMIEFGAMGKVYNIVIPIAEKLKKINETTIQSEKKLPQQPLKEFNLTEESASSFPSFLSQPDKLQTAQPVKQKNTIQNQPEPSFDKEQTPQNNIEEGMKAIREELLSSSSTEKKPEIIKSFANTQNALRNLRAEPSFEHTKSKSKAKQNKANKVISLDEIEKEIEASPDNNYDEYAYPFGAWIDDKKSK